MMKQDNTFRQILKQLQETDKYLSVSAISKRTGRHSKTVQEVLANLRMLNLLEEIETNNTTYYSTSIASETVENTETKSSESEQEGLA